MCLYTAVLWRCVFLHVWVWNRVVFFVCVCVSVRECVCTQWCDDRDSSLISVYMRVREGEGEGGIEQHIISHIKQGYCLPCITAVISHVSADPVEGYVDFFLKMYLSILHPRTSWWNEKECFKHQRWVKYEPRYCRCSGAVNQTLRVVLCCVNHVLCLVSSF